MLRRLPTSRLVLLVALACAVLGAGTALAAGALGGSGPKPPAKPLAVALHDALAAKPVAGVTARITFANRLIDGSGVGAGRAPLVAGAEGRLWAAPDGRFRLELQSDAGDAQITGDGRTVTLYDATTNSG
jgi:outer membrane lipoprotein-sorting protein